MEEDSIEIYLRLNKEDFESTFKRANQEAIDEDPNNEDAKKGLLFDKAKLNLNEFYVEDKSDEIHIDGILFIYGKEVGWIDFQIPFNSDIAVGIIDRYMKKLGKLKTVLEATK